MHRCKMNYFPNFLVKMYSIILNFTLTAPNLIPLVRLVIMIRKRIKASVAPNIVFSFTFFLFSEWNSNTDSVAKASVDTKLQSRSRNFISFFEAYNDTN